MSVGSGCAVTWGDLEGDGGSSRYKCEPFIVVEHVARAAGKWLLHVVIIDGAAIAIDVLAKHRRKHTSVASIGETRRRALSHQGQALHKQAKGECGGGKNLHGTAKLSWCKKDGWVGLSRKVFTGQKETVGNGNR